MTIDLTRFHSTFFEESLEGVAVMESELLEIERQVRRGGKQAAESLDAERLNCIFRAAHSIKGGSGTFGFTQVADFAHALESLLDEARSGHRLIDADTANLLLRAVDCLRALVHAAKDDGPAPTDVETLHAELERAQANAVAPAAKAVAAATASVWSIRFVPNDRFFHTGNDPLRIFRALIDLGPIATHADASQLPVWEQFDPQVCYLGWDIMIEKAMARDALDDVFAWVVGDCELTIEAPTATATATVVNAVAKVDEKAASSIRVATAKVDGLVDIVGELVITQTMLSQLVEDFTIERAAQLQAGVAQLARHTRELQDAVLGIRMLPLGFVFSRLPRLARDVATLLGKQVEMEISGDRTELDKAIIERISDPLIHLVRNSVDHGIEAPQERTRQGKPAHGTIRLNAYHKAGNVVIEVLDDGRGLDRDRIVAKARERGLIAADAAIDPSQIDEFIFMPGFSTSETVSDVSGRGVGLDVVRNNIRTLGGGVEVSSSPGQGTRFVIRLPLTLAIVDGMSLRVGSEIYILPLAWIAETLQVQPQDVTQPAGGPEIIAVRNEFVPLLRLDRIFNVTARATNVNEGLVVIVEADSKRIALFVDELLGQQQVVLKSLEPHCQRLEGISAATILGDGTVALILDAGSLVRQAHSAAAVLAAASNALHPSAAASAATLH